LCNFLCLVSALLTAQLVIEMGNAKPNARIYLIWAAEGMEQVEQAERIASPRNGDHYFTLDRKQAMLFNSISDDFNNIWHIRLTPSHIDRRVCCCNLACPFA
jgi:hypothetical protein